MRKPAKTFEDLLAWQKAHLFVLAVYRLLFIHSVSEA
jgi:hypothetical protein